MKPMPHFLVMAIPTSDVNFYFACQLQCNKPPQNSVSLKKTQFYYFSWFKSWLKFSWVVSFVVTVWVCSFIAATRCRWRWAWSLQDVQSCDCVLPETEGTLGSAGTLGWLDFSLFLHVIPGLLPSTWLFYMVFSHSLSSRETRLLNWWLRPS